MKISFSNIKENAFEQNVNKKETKLINDFLFYLSMVLSFLLISLYFALKSFNQEKISHEFSPNINYKNIFNEEKNISNINLRILITPNETDEEEAKIEEEKKKAREKIASNASKMNYAFYVFLIKSFYSILKMRAYKDEELEDKGKMKVYLYLYITNNGYLFASSVLILLYDFTYEEFEEGYILFYLSGGVFILGTIMAVLMCIRLCSRDQDFINSMYSYDSIKSLYKMPFASIKNFLLLKDRCCCCGDDPNSSAIQMPGCCCCSMATLLAKYLTLVVTAIIYYGSLLILTLILLIVISCLKICGNKKELNLEKEKEKENGNENEKRQERELSENIEGEQNLENNNNNNNTDNGLIIDQDTNENNPSGYNNY